MFSSKKVTKITFKVTLLQSQSASENVKEKISYRIISVPEEAPLWTMQKFLSSEDHFNIASSISIPNMFSENGVKLNIHHVSFDFNNAVYFVLLNIFTFTMIDDWTCFSKVWNGSLHGGT